MNDKGKPYVPAAGSDWLLPLYDPFTKLLGVEGSHRRLLSQAAIRPGDRLLEIGCGTGNLSIRIRVLHPEAEVVGIDPDPMALARARRKAERRGLAVKFDLGFAEQLPYPDASFDKAFSAFMFHHLKPAVRVPAAEIGGDPQALACPLRRGWMGVEPTAARKAARRRF